MEKLFENKTKLSMKEYNIFIESYKKEYAITDFLYILFCVLYFGLCMIFAFRERKIILSFMLLAGLCVFLWFKIIRPNKLVEKTKKSQKVSGNFVNKYEFYKNYFNIENPEGEAQVLYLKLYRVVETNSHFYIYVSRECAFIVSKIGFTKGKSDEFSKFIKKKVFTKYKNRMN